MSFGLQTQKKVKLLLQDAPNNSSVIVSIDGVAIEGAGDLMSALDGRAGVAVNVKVVRADQVVELKVITAARR